MSKNGYERRCIRLRFGDPFALACQADGEAVTSALGKRKVSCLD